MAFWASPFRLRCLNCRYEAHTEFYCAVQNILKALIKIMSMRTTTLKTDSIQAELIRQLVFFTDVLVGKEQAELFFAAFGDRDPAGFVTTELADLQEAPHGADVLAELNKPFIMEGLAKIAHNVLGDRNLFWSEHHCHHMRQWGLIVPMYQPKDFGHSELSEEQSLASYRLDNPKDLLTAIRQRLVGRGVISNAETHRFYGLTVGQAIPKLAPMMELSTGFIWK